MVEFQDVELKSMKTPSYPSGHATQGHLFAELLGKKYPTHYEEFKKLSNFISKSRIMARAHYPSDCVFGEEVAQHILGKVIQKKNETATSTSSNMTHDWSVCTGFYPVGELLWMSVH